MLQKNSYNWASAQQIQLPVSYKEGSSSRMSLRLDHRKGECHELLVFVLIKMQLVQKGLDEPQVHSCLFYSFIFYILKVYVI